MNHDLAVAISNGPWTVEAIAVRCARHDGRLLVDRRDRQLAEALVSRFPHGATALELQSATIAPAPGPTSPGRRGRPLADLQTVIDVARVLDVHPDDLDTLARRHRRDTDRARADHYRYHHRPTRGGGTRLIEAPKERLKEVQRRVLRRVLRVLDVHPGAHGATPGRGVLPAIAVQCGHDVVVCLDLERFFTAITAARIAGVLRGAGAGPDAAAVLARLTTNAVPRAVTADPALWARHLPQGAPTSPALADLVCSRLDRRLAALAARAELTYTRYVDDLTFAGPTVAAAVFVATVTGVVGEEGFAVNPAKTRVQRSSGRQLVLGAVVNAHASLPRAERDRLRAVVHNCRVHGWRTQLRGRPAAGFRDRLVGEVAWLAALDPVRGQRLRAELELVDWS